MQRIFHRLTALFLLGTMPFTLACQTMGQFHEALSEHSDPLVRYPTAVGNFVGAVVGIPVSILFLPVLLPFGIAASNDSKDGSRSDVIWSYIFIPMGVTLTTCGLLVGTPFWLLFGWWTLPPANPAKWFAGIPPTASTT